MEHPEDNVGTPRRALCAALGEVLPRLTRLTSLRIHECACCGAAFRALSPGLLALSGLRVLDVKDSVRYGAEGEELRRVLAAVLRKMTGLVELCLAYAGVGGRGWSAIDEAIATLPLQSLDLRVRFPTPQR